MTRIYTRNGDQGQTSLIGGKKVSKNSHRVEAYGNVDELNSFLGLARSVGLHSTGESLIAQIQNSLFDLGTELASDDLRTFSITQEDIKTLEVAMDNLDEQLPDLTNFILPCGSQAAAYLHVARAVCRRVERYIVELSEHETISPCAIPYINRLSDLLFTLARFQNQAEQQTETLWKSKKNKR